VTWSNLLDTIANWILKSTHGGMQVHSALSCGLAWPIALVGILTFHAPELFFLADHDGYNLLTACHTSAIPLLETGILSDDGRSDVAYCSHGNFFDACCISGNLGLRVARSLRSCSKQRKDSTSATLDHVILLHGISGPSPSDGYTV
jgi:hypothetical protein